MNSNKDWDQFLDWHFNNWKLYNAADEEVDFSKELYKRVYSHNHTSCVRDSEFYAWKAGAQSRQSEVDELNRKIAMYEKHVNAIKFIHENQFDKNSDTSWILGNLDGFFECLESDLKGKEGKHFDDVEWQPDWNQAPDWATAWSHDRLGSHWWDSAPEKGFDMWIQVIAIAAIYDKSPDFNYQGHWRDSLRKRPK